MARHRLLGNAPIQEALFDIQFDPGTESASLGSAVEHLVNRFADSPGDVEVSNLWDSFFEFSLTPGIAPPRAVPRNDVEGRRVDFKAKGQVLQLRPAGFAFSRLPKYVDWGEASLAAMALWQAFASHTKPNKIRRVGLRYINALQLPMPVENISDYLAVVPDVPKELPQTVANFLHRLILPKGDLVGQVTQAAQGFTEDQKHLKVLLDLDVHCVRDIEPDDVEGLSNLFAELRAYKNDLFFAFLTETTIGMYE